MSSMNERKRIVEDKMLTDAEPTSDKTWSVDASWVYVVKFERHRPD